MRLYILIGTSEGIGSSLAEQLLSPASELYCLSDVENPSLIKFSRMRQLGLFYQKVDFSQRKEVLDRLEQILNQLTLADWTEVSLIINFPSIDSLHRIGKGHALQSIQEVVEKKLLFPMLLSELFIRICQDWKLKKQLLFITGQTNQEPIASLSAYCSAKSGIDMFAQVLAKEQETETHPVQVVSVNPGMTDSLLKDVFKQQYKESEEKLLSPQIVGCEIVKLLKDPHFGKEPNMDISSLLVE